MSSTEKRPAVARKGRPPGSPNRDYGKGLALPSSCQQCKSTRKKVHYKTAELPQPTTLEHEGTPYNLIQIHRVECLDCGQFRMDRTLHFVPPAETDAA